MYILHLVVGKLDKEKCWKVTEYNINILNYKLPLRKLSYQKI